MVTRKAGSGVIERGAAVFAALGDRTRLRLITRLGEEPRSSISRLTEGTTLTRQAVTKHLRVLRKAGLVRDVRRGRERLFEVRPGSIEDARRALETMSRQWDAALARLKAFVEK